MAKQTAVEWLLENLNSEPYSEEEFNYNSNCWDKAKELEVKQRQEDTNHGYSQGWDDGNEGKEPMKPTIKSK